MILKCNPRIKFISSSDDQRHNSSQLAMNVSFSSELPEPPVPLKQLLQEASEASKIKKDEAWKRLSKILEETAKKRGTFTHGAHIETLGPLTPDDLEKMGFQLLLNSTMTQNIILSWSLDASNEPPKEGPPKHLFDLSFDRLSKMLTSYAERTGSRKMIVSKHYHVSPFDLVEWKRILRREGLDIQHRNGCLIIEW